MAASSRQGNLPGGRRDTAPFPHGSRRCPPGRFDGLARRQMAIARTGTPVTEQMKPFDDGHPVRMSRPTGGRAPARGAPQLPGSSARRCHGAPTCLLPMSMLPPPRKLPGSFMTMLYCRLQTSGLTFTNAGARRSCGATRRKIYVG